MPHRRWGLPPTAGHSNRRYSEAASTSEYERGVFSKEEFSINIDRI